MQKYAMKEIRVESGCLGELSLGNYCKIHCNLNGNPKMK